MTNRVLSMTELTAHAVLYGVLYLAIYVVFCIFTYISYQI